MGFKLSDKPKDKTFRHVHLTDTGYILKAPKPPWKLYGLPALIDAGRVIIVEGEHKVDSLKKYGFTATTSAGGAKNAKNSDWTPLAGEKQIIFWRDNHREGERYQRDVIGILRTLTLAPKISIVNPPSLDLAESQDVVNFVEQMRVLGKSDTKITAAISEVLKGARPTGPLAEYQERLRRIETGELACLPLPWPELARLTRLGAPGWLIVLAGRQGAAKTFFELELLRYWLNVGVSASAYWLEGDRGDLLDKTLAQVSGVAEVTDLAWQQAKAETVRELTAKHKDELDRVAAAVTVSAGLGLETLEDLASWIESEAEKGRRAIFVDPISAATRKAQPWISDMAFVRRAKRAARDYECSVIVISHLVKGADETSGSRIKWRVRRLMHDSVIVFCSSCDMILSRAWSGWTWAGQRSNIIKPYLSKKHERQARGFGWPMI